MSQTQIVSTGIQMCLLPDLMLSLLYHSTVRDALDGLFTMFDWMLRSCGHSQTATMSEP